MFAGTNHYTYQVSNVSSYQNLFIKAKSSSSRTFGISHLDSKSKSGITIPKQQIKSGTFEYKCHGCMGGFKGDAWKLEMDLTDLSTSKKLGTLIMENSGNQIIIGKPSLNVKNVASNIKIQKFWGSSGKDQYILHFNIFDK